MTGSKTPSSQAPSPAPPRPTADPERRSAAGDAHGHHNGHQCPRNHSFRREAGTEAPRHESRDQAALPTAIDATPLRRPRRSPPVVASARGQKRDHKAGFRTLATLWTVLPGAMLPCSARCKTRTTVAPRGPITLSRNVGRKAKTRAVRCLVPRGGSRSGSHRHRNVSPLPELRAVGIDPSHRR